ncbi:MAG: hypothetical protein GYB67_00850, partial [Chloroflexi bacterium]|nr:hypothetical protein [Chloroflexota bacterium]
MFRRLLPHHKLTTNPLFVAETRHSRWGHSADALLRRSRLWLLIGAGATLGIYLLLVVLTRLGTPSWFPWPSVLAETLLVIFAVGFPATTVAIDGASISATMNSINREIVSGRWDLLRLTGQRDSALIAAKHSAGQLRAWRTLSLVLGYRLAVALAALAVIGWVLTIEIRSLSGSSVGAGSDFTLFILSFSLMIIGLGAVFVIEPLWRLRAMTALGVWVSGRTRNPTTAGIVSFVIVLG